MSAQNEPVRFPSDFELTKQMLDWAERVNPVIDAYYATDKFKVYYEGTDQKGWLKTWKLWIRKEKPEAKFAFPKKKSKADIFADFNASLFTKKKEL